MANKRFNFTFEDGYEYEVTVYEGGGICIKNDIGGKILELGRWRMLDVLEILDSVRDDLKAANERYYNPIAKKEEERMDAPSFVNIEGWPCKFHSSYKGWALYRAWDIANDHGKMLYFAIDAEGSDHRILKAKNFDGIKKKVSEVERMELNESEICDAMAKTVVDFIDDEFTGWTEDEKATMKRLLIAFCDTLRLNLVDTECKKLDRMVSE